MTFDQILTASLNATLIIHDQVFAIGGIEKIKLASGEHITWMWSSEDGWFIVDSEGDELLMFHPVEQEVEMDEEGYAMYCGNSYEEEYEDKGSVLETEGNTDQEEGDSFEIKQFETDRGEILRRLTWVGYGEERWFIGKMLEEIDVRVD